MEKEEPQRVLNGDTRVRDVRRERLLDKPSIETEMCPFCGRVATNRHHILPRGMGGTKDIRRIPTVTVCGMGNASGCHGRLHDHTLELDWDETTGWWRYRYPKAMDAVWKPVPKEG